MRNPVPRRPSTPARSRGAAPSTRRSRSTRDRLIETKALRRSRVSCRSDVCAPRARRRGIASGHRQPLKQWQLGSRSVIKSTRPHCGSDRRRHAAKAVDRLIGVHVAGRQPRTLPRTGRSARARSRSCTTCRGRRSRNRELAAVAELVLEARRPWSCARTGRGHECFWALPLAHALVRPTRRERSPGRECQFRALTTGHRECRTFVAGAHTVRRGPRCLCSRRVTSLEFGDCARCQRSADAFCVPPLAAARRCAQPSRRRCFA
jgi:hypothetical protein